MLKLATIGLSNEQAEAVADMLASVEAATKAEAEKLIEQGRAKARDRWHKWDEKRRYNVSKRLPTAANASQQLAHTEDRNSNSENPQKEESKKAARGTRLPADFVPDIGFAISEGMPEAQARSAAASFVDFWRAKPGAGGVKLDWPATWRVWVRKSLERAPRPPPAGKVTVLDLGKRLLNEMEQANAGTDQQIGGHQSAPLRISAG
jgi:hypothetical protein